MAGWAGGGETILIHDPAVGVRFVVPQRTDSIQLHFVTELGVLTVLILTLAVALMLLRKRGAPVVAERA